MEQARNETLPPVEPGSGRQTFQQIVQHSDRLLEAMRKENFSPEETKHLTRRYTISQAAEIVGRHVETIRRAEAAGDLPQPTLSAAGRRTGYTLAEVNAMRNLFGSNPWRADSDEPIRLAFQNFKGGVSKSQNSVHFAQYLAGRGYRILLIDCDSQASSTAAFGLRPDLDTDADGTLLPFFLAEKNSLDYAIQETYWDRLHIIPASLALYGAEYALAAQEYVSGEGWVERLSRGIASIEHDYDVIIMDPPPALGSISLNVVRALNALIVPVPPAMYDFHSTVTFFRMMDEVLEQVEKHTQQPVNYKIFKLLVAKYDNRNTAQQFLVDLMTDHYTKYMLKTAMLASAEIDSASSLMKTVYELERPATSARETHERCLSSLNGIYSEIEQNIRRSWPSKKDEFSNEEGVLVR